ncbi:hypothetical protein H1235_08030 [Pseudoxanthomonas sp. NC8]|nr:hypothetical protein H1235_08030 [Pseudoxanthomonas sp. NC8]
MHRLALLGALATATLTAQGQTIKAQGPKSTPTKPAYRPAQPYNSAAKDTTPFNCDQYRSHPHPGMVRYCEGVEYMTLSNEARRQGRPGASRSVVSLPALGSQEASQLGYACVGGAFKRLPNGWEQVSAAEGGWQRCKEG